MSALGAALLGDLSEKDLVRLAEMLRPYLKTDDALLSPAQAAQRLGIHPKTLTRAAADGRVPGAVRVGRAWRFRADGLRLDPPARVGTPHVRLPRAGRPGTGAASAIRGGKEMST